MNVRLQLRKIVLGVLDDPNIEFNDALAPANCQLWDSVAMVQIVLAVEEAFEVRFTTNEIADLRSVGDLLKLLDAHGHRDEAVS